MSFGEEDGFCLSDRMATQNYLSTIPLPKVKSAELKRTFLSFPQPGNIYPAYLHSLKELLRSKLLPLFGYNKGEKTFFGVVFRKQHLLNIR